MSSCEGTGGRDEASSAEKDVIMDTEHEDIPAGDGQMQSTSASTIRTPDTEQATKEGYCSLQSKHEELEYESPSLTHVPSTPQVNMNGTTQSADASISGEKSVTRPVHVKLQRKKQTSSKIKDSVKSSKKQHKHPQRAGPLHRLGESHPPRVTSSTFKTLGSLASFLETRGIAVNPPKQQPDLVTSNPSPISEDATNQPQSSSTTVVETELANQSDSNNNNTRELFSAIDISTLQPGGNKTQNHRPLPPLFLSSTLLKTHTQLILSLEGMPEPPLMIYRDYNVATSQTRQTIAPKESNSAWSIPEADIIVSPMAGVILTTSQATTQQYLPGHRPSCPRMKNIKEINSPLRECVFRLSPRYEYLYVFVCHSMEGHYHDGTHETKDQQPPTAQKWLLSSMNALSAFCASLSREKQKQSPRARSPRSVSHPHPSPTVMSILVPMRPSAIISWVIELAFKHAVTFPEMECTTRTETEENRLLPISNPDQGALPYNNNNRGSYFRPQQAETRWELFLRVAGLNPFAAQAVLSVLRSQESERFRSHAATGDTYASTIGTITANNSLDNDLWSGEVADFRFPSETENVANIPPLSRFIEMGSEERRCLFEHIVGASVLDRVEAVIERDWQCDWALDFGSSANS